MKKIIAFSAGFLVAAMLVVCFFAFVSWFESPATWDPANRFLAAVLVVGAGFVAGMIALEYAE